MFSATEPLLCADAVVNYCDDVDITTDAVATPDGETASATMSTPTYCACSSAEQPSNSYAEDDSVIATIGNFSATKIRGLGVRSVPRAKNSDSILVAHLRRGTKVFVDGLVKATDEHSTKSVMFAAIRPFEIKPGGWIRGYVHRRHLALDGTAKKLRLIANIPPMPPPVLATICKLPRNYIRGLRVRSLPRFSDPRSIEVVKLSAGSRVIADGLVRAIDTDSQGNVLFFAQIRPMNPKAESWNLGYVQTRFLSMDSAAPKLHVLPSPKHDPVVVGESPIIGTVSNVPRSYIRGIGIRGLPHVHHAKKVRVANLRAGTRVVVDGLTKATDTAHDAKEVWLVQVRPMKPEAESWVKGFVRRKYLELDPPGASLPLLDPPPPPLDGPLIPSTNRLRLAFRPLTDLWLSRKTVSKTQGMKLLAAAICESNDFFKPWASTLKGLQSIFKHKRGKAPVRNLVMSIMWPNMSKQSSRLQNEGKETLEAEEDRHACYYPEEDFFKSGGLLQYIVQCALELAAQAERVPDLRFLRQLRPDQDTQQLRLPRSLCRSFLANMFLCTVWPPSNSQIFSLLSRSRFNDCNMQALLTSDVPHNIAKLRMILNYFDRNRRNYLQSLLQETTTRTARLEVREGSSEHYDHLDDPFVHRLAELPSVQSTTETKSQLHFAGTADIESPAIDEARTTAPSLSHTPSPLSSPSCSPSPSCPSTPCTPSPCTLSTPFLSEYDTGEYPSAMPPSPLPSPPPSPPLSPSRPPSLSPLLATDHSGVVISSPPSSASSTASSHSSSSSVGSSCDTSPIATESTPISASAARNAAVTDEPKALGENSGFVYIFRQRIDMKQQDLKKSDRLLLPIEVAPDLKGFEDAEHGRGLMHVDYANKYIGGKVLTHGLAQEEIRFAICPELICAMIFCEVMAPEESIQILGAEQFSSYAGYGFSLKYAGDYHDPSPRDTDGTVLTCITAIDAYDGTFTVGFKNIVTQLKRKHLMRELVKAYAGFRPPSTRVQALFPRVGTGNWGCGVFGGCPHLKALIQWVAASFGGTHIKYFPFDEEGLGPALQKLSDQLTQEHQIKVSTLWKVLNQLSEMSKADTQGLKPLCRTREAFFDTVLKRCLELHQSQDLW